MNKKLEQLFIDIENQRMQLVEEVRRSSDKFDAKPSVTKWSVHQILAHLITAEKLSVQYIAKKIQGIDQAGDTGLLEELKMLILKISQRLPFKFRAPKAVVDATPTYSGLDDLIIDWDETRVKFKQLLERFNDDQLRRKVFKHIIVGRLNIIHAVLFIREHSSHHIPQINRHLK